MFLTQAGFDHYRLPRQAYKELASDAVARRRHIIYLAEEKAAYPLPTMILEQASRRTWI